MNHLEDLLPRNNSSAVEAKMLHPIIISPRQRISLLNLGENKVKIELLVVLKTNLQHVFH
jgi:hypothetical protein